MNLTQKLRRSFEIMVEQMNYIFDDLVQTILGEHGLKKIDEFLIEFFIRFQDEAINEADKYEKVILIHTAIYY